MKTFSRGTLALALVLGLLRCSAGPAGEEGAAATVRDFYEHLDAGRFEEAKALYDDATRGQLFPDSGSDEVFREWAAMETHGGTLTDFNVVGQTESDGAVTIEFEVSFSDGDTVRRKVTATQAGTTWRLGFIG
jgi:hypothetical protein